MPFLIDIESVKSKLEIPRDETSFNLEVRNVTLAATARVVNLTGLDLNGPTTGVVDRLGRVRTGSVLHLARRPVAGVTQVRSRPHAAGASWMTPGYDLVDADDGALVLLGTQSGWPPVEVPPGARRPRAIVDLLEVTYDTAAYTAPVDLVAAIEDLASYWFRQARTNAVSSQSMGGISQSYVLSSMPPWVECVIARYTRRSASAWV